MSIDLSTYKQLYITTSFEQLQKIEEGVKLLSVNQGNNEGINTIYINAHTIVSKSMLMGYKQIGMLSHQIEKLFWEIKQGQMFLSPEILPVLSQATEGLRNGLETIKASDSEIDMSSQIAAIEKFIKKDI